MAQEVALHKRQQITRSGRMMFAWVAGASVIVGFSMVVAWFLVQHITFRHEVASAKHETVANLKASNEATDELRDNILVLETNEALNSAKAQPDEKALQVILDALPAEENALALGSSLQNVLVGGQPGVDLDELSVTDVFTGAESSVSTSNDAPASGGIAEVPFRMTVSSSDPSVLRDLLKRIEASVRIIDVDVIKIERNDTEMTMMVTGHAFYLSEKKVELKNQLLKPGQKAKVKK